MKRSHEVNSVVYFACDQSIMQTRADKREEGAAAPFLFFAPLLGSSLHVENTREQSREQVVVDTCHVISIFKINLIKILDKNIPKITGQKNKTGLLPSKYCTRITGKFLFDSIARKIFKYINCKIQTFFRYNSYYIFLDLSHELHISSENRERTLNQTGFVKIYRKYANGQLSFSTRGIRGIPRIRLGGRS